MFRNRTGLSRLQLYCNGVKILFFTTEDAEITEGIALIFVFSSVVEKDIF